MKTRVLLVCTLGIVGVIANPVSKQTIQSENNNPLDVEIDDSQTKQEEATNTSNNGDLEQKKATTIEHPQTPNNDEKVDIIIEENIVSQIDDGHQTLPESISGGGPLIGFNGVLGPQLAGSTDTQIPGFVTDSPLQQSGFDIANLLQLPEFVGAGAELPEFQSGFMHPGTFLNPIEDNPGPELSLDADDDLPIGPDYFREDMPIKIEHEIMETAAGFVPTPLVFRRKQKPRRRFATRRHFRRNPYRRHQFFYPYYYYAFNRPSSLRYY